jgi:hypothetical protein
MVSLDMALKAGPELRDAFIETAAVEHVCSSYRAPRGPGKYRVAFHPDGSAYGDCPHCREPLWYSRVRWA